jgi:hypothetical protein
MKSFFEELFYFFFLLSTIPFYLFLGVIIK